MNHFLTSVIVDEGERQATLLALAWLALDRPGWDYMLGSIAEKFDGVPLYNEFKRLNEDRVLPKQKPPLSNKILDEMKQFI